MPLQKWNNNDSNQTSDTPKVSILPNGQFVFNKAARTQFNVSTEKKYAHIYFDNETRDVVFEFVSATSDTKPVHLYFNKTGFSFSAKRFLNDFSVQIKQTTTYRIEKYKNNMMLIKITHSTNETPKAPNATVSNTRTKGPRFNFHDAKVPKGAILEFVMNPSETCTVISRTEVSYHNKTYHLSPLAKQLLIQHGIPRKAARGPDYFTYGGKTLTQRLAEIKAGL